MNKLTYAAYSYGTLYGTVRRYDTDGVDAGPWDITDCGLFFVVRDGWHLNSKVILNKFIGSGVTVTNGTGGCFTVSFTTNDLTLEPYEYVYGCFINPTGTTWLGTSTELKSIGSGIFKIEKNARYGTL